MQLTDKEPPYTVAEVAKMLHLSPSKALALFENEPGVIIFKRRIRRAIRIPRSVFNRVVEAATVRQQTARTVASLTVPEVARLLRVSRRTVIRWFEREPGVLVFGHREKMHKRGYRSLRIPEVVFTRFLKQRGLTLDGRETPK